MTLTPDQEALVIKAIHSDHTLTRTQQDEITEKIRDKSWFSDATIGAALGLAISKFLKLTPKAQALMTAAGFGIGKYLLDKSSKHDKFVQYNDKVRAYDIKT